MFPLSLAAGAVARLKNRTLVEAWAGWLEYCELKQVKREQLAAAVTFWTHRELASAFDQFRSALWHAQTLYLNKQMHWSQQLVLDQLCARCCMEPYLNIFAVIHEQLDCDETASCVSGCCITGNTASSAHPSCAHPCTRSHPISMHMN